MSLPPPVYPPSYGPALPPPRPAPSGPAWVGFAVLAGLLLAAAVAVTGLLFFGMLFAGDSCGTSAGTGRFCDDSGAWMLVAMFGPTVTLLAAVVTVVLGVVWARRPWTSLALGTLVYATGPAVALFTVFG
ncbi:hypothetical protein [Streptomyces arenae]|uniref:hypothetical protein n=1 Tax=Streptomyces arenae TaxID=29301 RepID=UPI00265A34F4|nr:hypothetical protein [Streptomyces arenae]MCG7203752.1 hypothetical protein [Streptomyces arenae]